MAQTYRNRATGGSQGAADYDAKQQRSPHTDFRGRPLAYSNRADTQRESASTALAAAFAKALARKAAVS